MKTVLCVMDDIHTRSAVTNILSAIEIDCLFCQTSGQVTPCLANPDISAVLLDATSGTTRILEICQEIRKTSNLPALVIIRAGQDHELAELMDSGTNDFVMSPLRADELMLRLQVLMLRLKQQHSIRSGEKLSCGEIVLDIQEHRVWKNGRQISISPMGFALLAYLLAHQSQVVTKPQLMQDVWGYTTPNESANLVEIGIARLRRELGEDPKQPIYLHTIWGMGYRFEYRAPGE